MSLPVPSLDDRKFQEIVDEAKRQIPELCPEWTNHNLSDPGVALIELFAWMTEMTLYRVNQIPERLYVKFLELMGVERFAATPATTSLTFWLSGIPDKPMEVPQGTRVSTTGAVDGNEVVFMTTAALPIRQPTRTACLTGSVSGFTDRLEDLQYGKDPFPVFESLDSDGDQPPAVPEASQGDVVDPEPVDAMYLGFRESLSNHVLELNIEATALGWGIEPASPPLIWEASTADGWETCHTYRDDTGGLNRNGSVVVQVPSDHVQHTIDGQSHHWLRVRLIEPKVGSHGYRTTPVVSTWEATTIGASVGAQHSEKLEAEELGVSDGSSGQTFTVSRSPTLPREPGETLRVVSSTSSAEWREVDNFDASGPDDPDFTWDSATGEIRFGPEIRQEDGSVRRYGGRPKDGDVVNVTGYRRGGGVAGNVGKMRLRRLLTTVPYVKSVENPAAATGGVDAETIENVKLRGPQYLRSGERAVTAGDYQRIALAASPQLARALCLPPEEPAGPVRLLLVPKIEPRRGLTIDDLALSEPLATDVAEYVDERRIIGTSIEIRGPYYEGVSVAATIEALPGSEEGPIVQTALEALYEFIDPLTGGPEGHGWPFGADLTAAAVREVLAAVPGVEGISVVLLSANLRQPARVGHDVDVIKAQPGTLFMSYEHKIRVGTRQDAARVAQ